MYLRVKPEGAAFEGRATGEFKFVVQSPPAKGEKVPRRSFVHVPLAVNIIPTPPRWVLRQVAAHQEERILLSLEFQLKHDCTCVPAVAASAEHPPVLPGMRAVWPPSLRSCQSGAPPAPAAGPAACCGTSSIPSATRPPTSRVTTCRSAASGVGVGVRAGRQGTFT